MHFHRFIPLVLAAGIGVQGYADQLLLQKDGPSDCPLAGPVFPAPSHLSNSALFLASLLKFEEVLSTKSLGLLGNDTALAIAVFSAKEKKTLYERYYTPPIDVGVEKVNRDSIFRVASVTKVFTVWTLLVAIGDSRFNDPITKYVPELANRANGHERSDEHDGIDGVKWEDVTVGDLASQSAGIARDEFLDLLLQKSPTWPSSHSPAYSNIAFTLLDYALQEITGKGVETTMHESIFKPLGMKQSSYKKTPSSGGVIPGDALNASWGVDFGIDNAGGSAYMSTGDLVKAGQAILQSSLISPALTRRWLKPKIMTGYLGAAVGAPWEITFLELANNRLVPYYSKDGDVLAYHSSIVLSPQHDIGFTVLTAGSRILNAARIRNLVKIKLAEILMPTVEDQAKAEARSNFNGVYHDKLTNSSLIIAAGYKGHPGLTIQSLVSRGVPLIGPGSSPDGPMASKYGIGNTTRLYPTTLKTTKRRSVGSGLYESRLGFRASWAVPLDLPGTIIDPCISAWASLDGVNYGKIAFDDWVFNMSEDGLAISVDIRMLKLNLVRDF